MKVIYIAGPYRAKTEFGVHQNIENAGYLALNVWKSGMAAFCPHKNTAYFGGACTDETWTKGGLEFLRRCDAVLLTKWWKESEDAVIEIEEAHKTGLPVFEDIKTLISWNQSGVL